MFKKMPVFLLPFVLCAFASILLSAILGNLLNRVLNVSVVPFARITATLIVMSVAIYVVVKRRLRIGRSRRALVKYQDILDAGIFVPGVLLFLDLWRLSGMPNDAILQVALLQGGACTVALLGLRFVLRRTLFTPEERAEIDVKRKTRRAVFAAAQRGSTRYTLGRLVGWRL